MYRSSFEAVSAAPSTREELQREYVSQAKALASAAHHSDSPWAHARQLGVTYGLGVGLYLRLITW